MKAFFENPDALLRLTAAVRRWAGTPFFPHGTTPGLGGGCSCQTLVAGVYRDAGFLPEDFFAPTGNLDLGRERMEKALAGYVERGWLAEVWASGQRDWTEPLPGDLLLFAIGRRGHLGVVSRTGYFLHILRHTAAGERRVDDPTYFSRIIGVWRPASQGNERQGNGENT